MNNADFDKQVRTEMRRIGVTGSKEEVFNSVERLPRDEVRFRLSDDGRLAEFRRTGWPVLVLSSRLTLNALKRVKKGAGAVKLWKSLALACE